MMTFMCARSKGENWDPEGSYNWGGSEGRGFQEGFGAAYSVPGCVTLSLIKPVSVQ